MPDLIKSVLSAMVWGSVGGVAGAAFVDGFGWLGIAALGVVVVVVTLWDRLKYGQWIWDA